VEVHVLAQSMYARADVDREKASALHPCDSCPVYVHRGFSECCIVSSEEENRSLLSRLADARKREQRG